jgi:hypothetical protein
MIRYYLLMLGLLAIACQDRSEKRGEGDQSKDERKVEKRPLKYFTQEDVAKYAVSVVYKQNESELEAKKNGDEILVNSKSPSDGRSQYMVKLGNGIVLFKDRNGDWQNILDDRRVFYNEEGDTLIISEGFVTSDSSTMYQFVK